MSETMRRLSYSTEKKLLKWLQVERDKASVAINQTHMIHLVDGRTREEWYNIREVIMQDIKKIEGVQSE